MTADELREIVISEYKKANYDRHSTLVALNRLCDENEELMMAFASYGAEILKALLERQRQTLQ